MKTATKTNELVKVIESNGLEAQTSIQIKEKFLPFFDQANEWKIKAESLVVTDASQTEEMKMAREGRLALRDIRVGANNVRKSLKEDSLRYGKAVQGVYNVIEGLIMPIEDHLLQQEKFVEIQEEATKQTLKFAREKELEPVREFVGFGINVGDISEEDYQKLLNGAKLQQRAAVEAIEKEEKERIAKEKAEAKERKRIRIENERLKAEAEIREKQLARERAKAEADLKVAETMLRIERESKEKQLARERAKAETDRKAAKAELRIERESAAILETQIKAKADAEAKAKKEVEYRAAAVEKEQQEAERKAASAPDRAKLTNLSQSIDRISFPEVKSEEAQKILNNTRGLLKKVSTYIQEQSLKL